METHEHDPTDKEQSDPWDAVTSEIGSLGNRLKDTYRRVAGDGGPSEDDIKGAFATLIEAWDQVAESVSTALQDPETRNHLKEAASSFATAMGETMSGLGDELKNSSTRWSSASYKPGDQPVQESGSGGGVVHGDDESATPDEPDL